jgi:hypothetical protein
MTSVQTCWLHFVGALAAASSDPHIREGSNASQVHIQKVFLTAHVMRSSGSLMLQVNPMPTTNVCICQRQALLATPAEELLACSHPQQG